MHSEDEVNLLLLEDSKYLNIFYHNGSHINVKHNKNILNWWFQISITFEFYINKNKLSGQPPVLFSYGLDFVWAGNRHAQKTNNFGGFVIFSS